MFKSGNKMMALGAIADDPPPPELMWQPTPNGRGLWEPLILGNSMSFGLFKTRDGWLVTSTGMYPHNFTARKRKFPRFTLWLRFPYNSQNEA